jgi:hypothetical protein
LGDALGMIYQLGLQHELLAYVTDNDLLTSAQGACQANRQPYDTVYTLTEFITSRQQTQRQPLFGSILEYNFQENSYFATKIIQPKCTKHEKLKKLKKNF